MKNIECAMGITNRCTGSSKFGVNGTTVFCTVKGPMEVSHKFEDPKKAHLEVTWKEGVNLKTVERYYSCLLHRILSKYILLELDPYKMIQINLFIAEHENNVLFCAVNACLLALVDAGIPLKSLFYGTTSNKSEEELMVYSKIDDTFQRDFIHTFGSFDDGIYREAEENLKMVMEFINFEFKSKMDEI